jgi:hypothetical protein
MRLSAANPPMTDRTMLTIQPSGPRPRRVNIPLFSLAAKAAMELKAALAPVAKEA